jgi:CheY-specific phosphatase CheX
MKDGIKAAMSAATGYVLETMFFMSTEVGAEETPTAYFSSLKDGVIGGRVDFSGPFGGRFFILIPEALLYAMTESFLSLEREQIEERHLSAMIKEILNMVAGNTFSTYNPDHVYDLGIPERVSAEAVAQALDESGGKAHFLLVDTIQGRLALAILQTN